MTHEAMIFGDYCSRQPLVMSIMRAGTRRGDCSVPYAMYSRAVGLDACYIALPGRTYVFAPKVSIFLAILSV